MRAKVSLPEIASRRFLTGQMLLIIRASRIVCFVLAATGETRMSVPSNAIVVCSSIAWHEHLTKGRELAPPGFLVIVISSNGHTGI